MLPASARDHDIATDEVEMNLTPMIDVVFQLIVFFLLSLKFKAVDRRIESALPRDRGPTSSSVFVEEIPTIVAKLFRVDHERPDEAFTRVRIGNHTTVDLPAPDDPDRALALAKVRATLAQAWAARGRAPAARGEIKTPSPTGALVPHGDVMGVLDAFLRADIADVVFEGAAPPRPDRR